MQSKFPSIIPCEGCRTGSGQAFGFVVWTVKDSNPFEAKERAVGRWRVELCSACGRAHWKRTLIALLVAIGVFLIGAAVRFIAFPKVDVALLDLAGGFLTLCLVYGLYETATLSAGQRGERAAVRAKSGEYVREGFSLQAASEYRSGNQPDRVDYELLPELPPGRRIEALRLVLRQAAPAGSEVCDFCRQPSGAGGLQIPFVAGWVQLHSGVRVIQHTYYGFAPISMTFCPACIQKAPVAATLKALKKSATEKGRRAIAANQKSDKPLFDSESVLLLSPEVYLELVRINRSA